MEPARRAKYQKLIQMMEAFVAGDNTSPQFVKDIEAEFGASGLIQDDRFHDLLVILDLFAVPSKEFGYASDPKPLANECRYVLRLLKNET